MYKFCSVVLMALENHPADQNELKSNIPCSDPWWVVKAKKLSALMMAGELGRWSFIDSSSPRTHDRDPSETCYD